MLRKMLTLVVLVLAALLAACGDDDGGDDADAATATTATAPAATGATGVADAGSATSTPDEGSDAARDVVRSLQEDLRSLGFYDGSADGEYGPATEAAVRSFQSANGLAVDGVVGPDTKSAINLGLGRATSDAVRLLQQLLVDLCYDPGPVDGDYGPGTEDAVRRFQADQGLGVDGRYGPRTASALATAHAAAPASCDDVAGGGGGGVAGEDDATAAGATISLSSELITDSYVVTRCDAPTETTLALEAASVSGSVTLVIETVSGAGTLRLDGSDDQDGLTITGEVTSVIVGDAGNVSIEGILPTAERDVPFTVNGTCAGS